MGGALLEPMCHSHACGTAPVTCACLGIQCAGGCQQTGTLDFTCNTCPPGPPCPWAAHSSRAVSAS